MVDDLRLPHNDGEELRTRVYRCAGRPALGDYGGERPEDGADPSVVLGVFPLLEAPAV
jgi:hypothetical protein